MPARSNHLAAVLLGNYSLLTTATYTVWYRFFSSLSIQSTWGCFLASRKRWRCLV